MPVNIVLPHQSGSALTSDDGITWTQRTIHTHLAIGGVWSQEKGLYVTGVYGNVQQVATSPDGITWTLRAAPYTYSRAFAWSPELGLFASGYNDGIATSPDGITWTARGTGRGNIYGLTWSSTKSLFVSVGNSGIFTSLDGIGWTNRLTGTFFSVIWVADFGLFIAGRTDGFVFTSPDGINWTSRTTPASGLSYGITYSPSLKMVVAGGSSGIIVRSTDGINWSSVTVNTVSYHACVWSEYAKLFTVAGQGLIYTSPDGVTWTERINPIGGTNTFYHGIARSYVNAVPTAPNNLAAVQSTVHMNDTLPITYQHNDPDSDPQAKTQARWRKVIV